MSIQITIDCVGLAETVLNNTEYVGSTDWDIYVSTDGAIDVRHNTHSNGDWFELIDLYSFWGDDETMSCTVEEMAEFLKSDAVELSRVEDKINLDRYDAEQIELVWK